MPKVQIKHTGITSDDATKSPKREPVPPGWYSVLIINAALGFTKHVPPLQKVVVQFQVVHPVDPNGNHDPLLDEESQKMAGRRVFQDYILEGNPSQPLVSEIWRHELRQLLDATGIVYTDEGFDTDHLINRPLLIEVSHTTKPRVDDQGRAVLDENGKPVVSIWTSVSRADCLPGVDGEDDLI